MKGIRKQAEAEKVNVRNVRRDTINVIGKPRNKHYQGPSAKIRIKSETTDKYIKAVDEVVAAKKRGSWRFEHL